ncbi:MAG: AAA family ATPase [Rhodospirillales bacterium]|nr:AAA family ATPase [Rhodospirillales bacterium]
MCEAEARINRRTAPTIYRGLVAVTRDEGGRFALDGAGEAVDWLVEMVRFDETALFDAMAERGALSLPQLEELAEAIAHFHRTAERRPGAGGGAAMASLIENNAQSFAACPDDAFDADAVAELLAGWRGQLEDRRAQLDRRRAGGAVRHCHGDLHLGNIVLYEGRPTLFDAIEFNDAFCDIDILYDLAFLLMDLAHRDRADLAAVVFNRYLDAAGDSGGLDLLPLFVSLRAGIRAHVTAVAAAAQSERGGGDRPFAGARRYLRHARAALRTDPPRLVAIGGLSGTGKSSLARTLAPMLFAAPGARVLRTDCIRKRLAGVGLGDRLGADGYSREVTQETYRALVAEADRILAAGRTVIADGVFAAAAERAAVRELAGRLGVPFAGLWLDAPPTTLEARVRARRGDVSDAGPEVVRMQLGLDLGALDWVRVNAAGSAEAAAAAARRVLRIG